MATTKPEWITRDGRRIPIRDMSDTHLLNTLALLDRRVRVYEEQTLRELYTLSTWVTGEIATMDIENRIMEIEEHGLDPAEVFEPYKELAREAQRRNLDHKLYKETRYGA